MGKIDLNEISIIKLPKILDERGNLSFIENHSQLPFEIARVYWIYDVPGGFSRGGHAYKNLTELVIALSGSFEVVLNNGYEERTFFLKRSYEGLLIPKMLWRRIENFSTNSLALIATDGAYNEHNYIRDYDKYKSGIDQEILSF